VRKGPNALPWLSGEDLPSLARKKKGEKTRMLSRGILSENKKKKNLADPLNIFGFGGRFSPSRSRKEETAICRSETREPACFTLPKGRRSALNWGIEGNALACHRGKRTKVFSNLFLRGGGDGPRTEKGEKKSFPATVGSAENLKGESNHHPYPTEGGKENASIGRKGAMEIGNSFFFCGGGEEGIGVQPAQ